MMTLFEIVFLTLEMTTMLAEMVHGQHVTLQF